jgi:hypothetical protein
MISNFEFNNNDNGFQQEEFLNAFKPIEHLINNNVLDFTSKNIYIYIYIYAYIVLQQFSLYITKHQSTQIYTAFIDHLHTSLLDKIRKHNANVM